MNATFLEAKYVGDGCMVKYVNDMYAEPLEPDGEPDDHWESFKVWCNELNGWCVVHVHSVNGIVDVREIDRI